MLVSGEARINTQEESTVSCTGYVLVYVRMYRLHPPISGRALLATSLEAIRLEERLAKPEYIHTLNKNTLWFINIYRLDASSGFNQQPIQSGFFIAAGSRR